MKCLIENSYFTVGHVFPLQTVGIVMGIDPVQSLFIQLCLFNFHIVRMSPATSEIPSIIFYSSTVSEFVRITSSTFLLKDF